MVTHLYCPRCGIQHPIGTPRCPSCSEPLPTLVGQQPLPKPYPRPQPDKLFWSRRRVWRLQSALLASSAITAFLIDYLDGFQLSWSPRALLSIAFAWICGTLFIQNRNRPVRALPGIFLALTGFLLLLDALDGTLTWALSTGLPIAATTVGLAYYLLKGWPPPVGKRAAFLGKLLIVVSAESLIVDLLTGDTLISWSAIIIAAAIPLTIFLLLYHRERARWERFLRL